MKGNCPCNSGDLFQHCCEPVILNSNASTAEQLMRSRYTAYATGNAEYLFETAHPKHRKGLTIKGISDWAEENNWLNLEITFTSRGSIQDVAGTVEFKAYFTDKKGVDQIHHERSEFVKENEKWYYTTATFDPKEVKTDESISRNDPCPCGSGKKYKKCCG